VYLKALQELSRFLNRPQGANNQHRNRDRVQHGHAPHTEKSIATNPQTPAPAAQDQPESEPK
jgi:hypothetical protein